MKKIIYTTTLAMLGLLLNAQIKVWSGGTIGMGYTSATPTWPFTVQTVGSSVFTSSAGSITSAPAITGTNTWGTPGAPDYTWCNDAGTGMFHPGPSPGHVIGFTIAGTEAARINTNRQFLMTALASSTKPEYSWKGDSTTGMYHPASNIIGFSVSGSEKARFTTNGLLIGTTTDPGSTSMVITAPANFRALTSTSNFSADYGYHQINNVNRANTKAFVVQQNGTDEIMMYGNGGIYCVFLTQTSDRNLKENIDTLRGALAKIKKLQGVTYNLKTSVTGLQTPKAEIGLIAQDVEQVVPQVVYTSDKGIKGIAYTNLTALLIEAIKAQDKRLDSLGQALSICCNARGTGNRSIKPDTTNGSMGQRTLNNNQLTANGSQSTNAILYQNIPNPFTQTTVVKCFIPQSSQNASLLVFDLNGSLKKTIAITGKGEVNTTINGRELVSGMYYYTLLIDGQEIDTKKMILTE